MLLIMSSVISDKKHGHLLLILMGKIKIESHEFTTSRAARHHLRTV